MGKIGKRLSFALASGAACVMSFAPAAGQQTSNQQTTGQQTTSQQTTGQQTPNQLTSNQQTPSQQLIRQRALQNPARRLALPAGQQLGTGEGLSVTLDYLSTFRYDDNLRLTNPSLGSTSRWENLLGIGVVNQTPDSTLTFDLSGLIRIYDEPVLGSDTEFNDPLTRLTYLRDRANSRFSGLLEYRSTDLNFNRSLTDINQDGIIDAGDVVISSGDRADGRINLDWQTGLNDPLGFQLTYNRYERTYTNTTDPDLFDNEYDDFAATVLLRFSPVLQGNVSLGYIGYTAEDQERTDRKTTTLSTGISYDVSAVTTINADIGVTQVDETLRTFNTNTVDEDYVARFSWFRELPDGSVNALLDHTFGVNGARTNATVGRDFQRPNGSFDFNIGLTHGPFGETTVIGDLNYVYTVNRSQITATAQRRVDTSTQSRETRQTLAYFAYDYFINQDSALSLSIDYVDQEEEGPGPTDPLSRTNITAAYTRAITKDWAMTLGYQYLIDEQRQSAQATGSSIYFTLGRRLFLKP